MRLFNLHRGGRGLVSAAKESHCAGIRRGTRFSCHPPKLLGITPIPELLDKRLVFVTGKGGVGKTTVAVALGLRAAEEGKRTIVCEVSSQENASRIFEHTEVGFHEV